MKSLQNQILSSKAVCLCFCEVVVMESTKSIPDALFLAALKITTEEWHVSWKCHVYFVLHMLVHETGVTLSFIVYLNGNKPHMWQLEQ